MHGTLGLISGLVVFVLGVTGFLYSFEKEIQEYTQDFRFFEIASPEYQGEELLPSQLIEIAHKKLPNHEIHSVKYLKWQPELNLQQQKWNQRTAEVIFYHSSPDSTYYYKVFVNPFSGEVLQVHNMLEGFFAWVLKGHFYLWLPAEIGKVVVSTATLLFFLLIFLGLILWLPKRWTKFKNWKSRIWLQWNGTTRWRRKNFDLHSVIGFYSFLGAFILSITGLYYGYNWWAMMYYKLLGGDKEVFFEVPKANETGNIMKTEIVDSNVNRNVIDNIYSRYKSRLDTGVDVMMEIHPQEELNKCIEVSFNSSHVTYGGSDYIFVHPENLESQKLEAVYGNRTGRTFADKMMLWNYDIHTGGIWGWWGKLIMAIFSLLIATLPITGFLMWWGRQNKP